MKFIPNSTIKNEMLTEIGLKNIYDLFSDIPKKIKVDRLGLPRGLSQQETERKLRNISNKNKPCTEIKCFLGGGIKPHYVPPVVKAILSRSEFYTSYTPYQSEASQGFLQAMFEYQSMIAEITKMDIANASLYDGSTALGEAALMCTRINRRKTFFVPQNISWEKKSVLKNYVRGPDIKVKETSYDKETGKIDLDDLKKHIDDDTAGVYVENPNFFGIFEDQLKEINAIVKENGSLFVVGVDLISLGIIRTPGEYNADIVIGEGRALGGHMSYGGSSLGFFACKSDFVRQLPGRLIGMTHDADGNRAFCMTLQTREQHIRRGKATSNICTNEGLCALAAVVYLSWLGSTGLENLSKINFEKGQKLAEEIVKIDGFKKRFSSFHFNEFVIECKKNPLNLNQKLLNRGFQGGLLIEGCPELKNCMLFGVTETHTDEDIENFVKILKEVANV